ncbi:cell division protein FtsA [Sporobacter termitidis DSM 10068]|uniref:Cell division protein FtsA n=1 Tax=Sporobacter termitidis DSM 10068 TaxID=1123282 RepID=A0A1M5X4J8_9FIRM|nr:cell division FtsA domain-containing protein [Sporobacter termitidis]SHH94739.1 cell division protein FtsA [Sporobacter termitidis DSM 10068]
MSDSSKKRLKAQPKGMIFALDIGTRSIIGIAGTVEGEKLRVMAMEKEEHTQRSMIDGQIEDIEQVAKVARTVTSRLEAQLGFKLKRVCVAAAGRALRTQRASYKMEFPQPQRLDKEIISQLEAGAISEAEAAFTSGLDIDSRRQFYLVGHTAVQYYMDNYPISSLLDHQARQIQADVIATFLPSEVVESLYAAMHRIGLEVASLTLEPIAAINAVIPKNLRLLNLALVDIGAGTSDIAVSRDGGVVGYTMVTVAGDEITEALMKNYLLDFNAAESVKMQLGAQKSVSVTDILGIEQTITQDDMMHCIEESAATLCREIAEHICEVNGGPASAVFLAGGGSKLASIRAGIASYMNVDVNRVAIAGNNFQTYAFSDTYDLNDPEYATPLGIAISAGLNMITESFHVTLNGSRARLFRNSTMTVLDILMMNGFSYQDLLPRTGQKLTILLNGSQTVFYGTPGDPAVLLLNGREAKISDVVYTGDSIDFTPAVHGQPAQCRLKDLLAGSPDQAATVNGGVVPLDTPLKNGDAVITASGAPAPGRPSPAAETAGEPAVSAQPAATSEPDAPVSPAGGIELILNNKPVVLPGKPDGSPYYLMDMLEWSGIDLENPTGEIVLRVNGSDSTFLQDLKSGDRLEIFFAPGHAGKPK